ncbi:hypothetical protein PAUR_a1161 [Pseudoalteromonas aurantia 208]|uniref:Uncharacterized protein n=1 Tax=Pseudoalteromonas aurantia 208 TaxID=1314867 RepID=A0ABR9E9T3_9GAMM|nr:hypothetical protein [Pseudoalteromonas aurantia 208]
MAIKKVSRFDDYAKIADMLNFKTGKLNSSINKPIPPGF